MAKQDKNIVTVKQTRSLIGSTKKQVASIKGLGLLKLSSEILVPLPPAKIITFIK